MNWTGGSRARSSKPSSDTARLQKSYFAKVRAKNTTPLAHAGLSFAFNGDGTSVSGNRRKARVPELDIVRTQESQKKRKACDTSHGLMPFEELTKGADKSGGNRSSDIKTKKQRLLEKDSWVCTTLARPLVLKSKQAAVDVRSKERSTPEILRNPELFLDPISQEGIGDVCESQPEELNYSRYPSLERRSTDSASNGGRGPNHGAFRNLSDGGFIQIGGESTQFGGSTSEQRGFAAREMSHISEETMLFDIEGRQEENSPPLPPKVPNLFARKPGVETFRKITDDTVFSPNDWSAIRDAHMHGGFPSSPLAPYSQVPREWGLSTPVNKFTAAGQKESRDIIEEIDEAATDIWSSSPFEDLPATNAQPRVMPSSLTQMTNNIHASQGRTCGKRLRNGIFADRSNGLGSLLQEDDQQTQDQSLIAYASSESSSDGEDEGEEWMLGSNISPRSSQGSKASDSVPAVETEGGWEMFLKDHTANEDLMDTHEDEESNEPYVQEDLTGFNALDESTGSENLEETSVQVVDECDGNVESQESHSQDFIESLNLEYREKSVVPLGPRLVHTSLLASDEEKEENWREFIKIPQAQLGDDDTEVEETVEQEISIEKPDTKPNEEVPQITLEFDKDEDNAWRAFVFAGLSDEVEPEPEPPKPPEPLPRRATLPLKSSLKPPRLVLPSSPEPEPQLPANISPKENLYAPSMAGATVGSGSDSSSGDTSSVADSSPVAQKTSKFFDCGQDLASLPPVIPVGTVPRRSRSMLPIGLRGRGNLYTKGQQKSSKRERGAKADANKNTDKQKASEEDIDDIEEW